MLTGRWEVTVGVGSPPRRVVGELVLRSPHRSGEGKHTESVSGVSRPYVKPDLISFVYKRKLSRTNIMEFQSLEH